MGSPPGTGASRAPAPPWFGAGFRPCASPCKFPLHRSLAFIGNVDPSGGPVCTGAGRRGSTARGCSHLASRSHSRTIQNSFILDRRHGKPPTHRAQCRDTPWCPQAATMNLPHPLPCVAPRRQPQAIGGSLGATPIDIGGGNAFTSIVLGPDGVRTSKTSSRRRSAPNWPCCRPWRTGATATRTAPLRSRLAAMAASLLRIPAIVNVRSGHVSSHFGRRDHPGGRAEAALGSGFSRWCRWGSPSDTADYAWRGRLARFGGRCGGCGRRWHSGTARTPTSDGGGGPDLLAAVADDLMHDRDLIS